jgi:magnesium-transporting ATPase (P-type)
MLLAYGGSIHRLSRFVMQNHHAVWELESADVYEHLHSILSGLTTEEAEQRLQLYGGNELPEPHRRSLFLRFIDQLTHFMALLLWVAGILAFVSNNTELGWAIWAVIWINAMFSFWQEFQAEQALAALKNVLPTQVKVYRSGQLQQILAKDLVPGDVMQLEEGDRISADARLVEAESLYVDMSVLTGESVPAMRISQPVKAEKSRASDAKNLVFAGATVLSGRGRAVVYATGTHTEFGQVAHLTANIQRDPSTLEVQITRVVHVITAIAVMMGGIVFFLTRFSVGMTVKESLIFAIGIIVAFVPEGLLPTVSLALAIGVQRMAKKNALVRRLSAVETLSTTTMICTDKTGTLTKNEMTVRELWISRAQGIGEIEITGAGYDPNDGVVQMGDQHCRSQVMALLSSAALCCNAQVNRQSNSSQWQALGDPTEAAIVVAAMKYQINLADLKRKAIRQLEIPFDSNRRRMSVVVNAQHLMTVLPTFTMAQASRDYLTISKGASNDVLQRCVAIFQDDQILPIDDVSKARILAANDRLASHGYRVLGVAWGFPQDLSSAAPDAIEQGLIFLGLVAMIDPPRPEVAEAIAKCHEAGIHVTMITGDYGLTAEAIARRVGLINGKTRIITGEQLAHLSNADLRQLLIHRRHQDVVFARMMPEQKLRLVQVYKELGHIVAVTGDGVNDAPALRAAHIGIAMGLNGTDVAREAADIVLLDDNFATIVSAIEQGRAIYQNIRKFMTYILASNIPEFVPFLAMVLFKIPPALVILQILAIDLGTDMVPAIALGAEPAEIGTMQQPPHKQNQPLLDRALLVRSYCILGVVEGLLGILGFLAVWLMYGYDLATLQAQTPAILARSADTQTMAIYYQAMTVMLAIIIATQTGNVFACRSERVGIKHIGFGGNSWIWAGIAVEWILLLALMYLPPLQAIFSTAVIAPAHWLMLVICPPIMLWTDTLHKRLRFRKHRALPKPSL